MSIAKNLERRLERLVDGISASLFRGALHPVEIANRLVRQADLSGRDTVVGQAVPNVFDVAVSPGDLDGDADLRRLEAELADTVVVTARDRGWRLDGPVRVGLTTDAAVRVGSIRCHASFEPGPLAPWARLIDAGAGQAFGVAPNRALIGRADECDVTLDDPAVSRHHAVLFREDGKAWVADLGSANGTTCNGGTVTTKPVTLHAGDVVGFGAATLSFRPL